MALLKIKLTRNLRRSILRGHPWIYKEAIASPGNIEKAQLCLVSDQKGELAWAIYDPHGPLSLRVISTEKGSPNQKFLEGRFQRALALRAGFQNSNTNAYRLFNGEGDGLPGLVCDIYDKVAVVQFDGQGPSEYWNREWISGWLMGQGFVSVLEKTRKSMEKASEILAGAPIEDDILIQENGARFKVNVLKGQKTGFFLDQRDNRSFVRGISRDQSVLNLFSYSGGFSIYAGLGQAKDVTSVDVSKGAIEMSEQNWALNDLNPSHHKGVAMDVFEYLSQADRTWDHVIVDPPSMSHSEENRELAKSKYVDVFKVAAQKVSSNGRLSLSSCSSHISFDDFFEIIEESLSQARRKGQTLRVSGQGADHPFPHVCYELRYLKFVHLALD